MPSDNSLRSHNPVAPACCFRDVRSYSRDGKRALTKSEFGVMTYSAGGVLPLGPYDTYEAERPRLELPTPGSPSGKVPST